MTKDARIESQFVALIADEIGCRPQQVGAADALLGGGGTVPFIARYRKEATGGLDDAQLEMLAKRRTYFLELQTRRDTVLSTVAEQGELTPQLDEEIRAAVSKRSLEDLYLPYRPKSHARAQVARERGLEPLADALLTAAPSSRPAAAVAKRFVVPEQGVASVADALAGARDVLAERFSERADNRARLRAAVESRADLRVVVKIGTAEEAAAYRDYFDHCEPVRSIPSHRLLAILRGEKEGFLSTTVELDDATELKALAGSLGVPLNTPCGREIATALADSYVRLLRPSIVNEVMAGLRERAEAEAIAVIRANLEALLLQPPLGRVPVMGADPGYRTGCKLAVVDATGKVLDTAIIRPLPPKADEKAAGATVVDLVRAHEVKAIAVGNRSGGRETEVFLRAVLAEESGDEVVVTIVPETGASMYSASKLARQELSELDVAERGAVSIARRLQDPLAELVKIEPRALGVGQYQHDVNQKRLGAELRLAVEGVVNRVGVEVNSASAALLRYVSGLSPRLANAVVAHRDDHGPFRSRQDLGAVSGLGPKRFEVAAGFLRVRGGDDPLDATAVHPERYPVVEAMAAGLGVGVADLVGNPKLAARVTFDSFADDASGLGSYTLAQIESELQQPGRDPRPRFRAPRFRPDVVSLDDLRQGMTLEGRVSNVTNFGAFVDVGVKRHGLVHISEMSWKRFEDPRGVARVGDVVAVKVTSIDLERARFNLSIKALQRGDDAPRGRGARERKQATTGAGPRRKRPQRGQGAKKRPEARPATVDDLINKFGGKRVK